MGINKMKKSLIIVALICAFAFPALAGEESLQAQKDAIWAMATLYKLDNQKRAIRLPAAPKAKIGRPIYRPRTKRASNAIAPATNAVTIDEVQSRVLNYTAITAWGTYKAEVIEYPGKPYFDVTFESEHPIQGLVIRDGPRKMDVYTVYFNDVKTPPEPIRINYAYSPTYLMILKANIDGEIQPQIIALYKKDTQKIAQ
jgi:hypothetical protein